MKKKKIYISGKMNGLSAEQIEKSFTIAEGKLLKYGAVPVNPNKVKVHNMDYEELLQIDFKIIDLCDGIFLIDNWIESEGAKRERAYAKAVGKPIFEEDQNGELVEL